MCSWARILFKDAWPNRIWVYYRPVPVNPTKTNQLFQGWTLVMTNTQLVNHPRNMVTREIG